MENLDYTREPISRVFRGEIWFVDLGYDNKLGQEQQGKRPVLIVGNEMGNKNSSCITVAPITGSTSKTPLDTHQVIQLKSQSTVLYEQILTISKDRLKFRLGKLNAKEMFEANYKLALALGLMSL